MRSFDKKLCCKFSNRLSFPTQQQALSMVCAQVGDGQSTTVTFAGAQGHLELNAFKPVIIHNVLQSIRLLADVTTNFTDHCVVGIVRNTEHIAQLLTLPLNSLDSSFPQKRESIIAAGLPPSRERQYLRAGLIMQQSLVLVTALVPHIGYDNAAYIAKSALANRSTLREEIIASGFLSAEGFDTIVRPERMITTR